MLPLLTHTPDPDPTPEFQKYPARKRACWDSEARARQIARGHLGLCQDCALSDLRLSQNATGKVIQGKTERIVLFENKCKCAIQYVELNCKGFQTVEKIDQSVLLGPTGDGRCLFLNKNQVIKPNNVARFAYAFDPQFNFSVKDFGLPNGTFLFKRQNSLRRIDEERETTDGRKKRLERATAFIIAFSRIEKLSEINQRLYMSLGYMVPVKTLEYYRLQHQQLQITFGEACNIGGVGLGRMDGGGGDANNIGGSDVAPYGRGMKFGGMGFDGLDFGGMVPVDARSGGGMGFGGVGFGGMVPVNARSCGGMGFDALSFGGIVPVDAQSVDAQSGGGMDFGGMGFNGLGFGGMVPVDAWSCEGMDFCGMGFDDLGFGGLGFGGMVLMDARSG
ncbi:hypothetical protein RHSIM_Rhsim04G0092100 [Rhododendron simsii]|uniref:Uncharacterized protein n=1 Tax=Rhododendron simsii TaxID=118357 RepID=A0A834LQM8_RHOSS|nr:hypothetical protein RHSIM_Rhsim04G0092100 [Rhododendron simsii]